MNEVLPAKESCATPEDDNCDGQANEGCACVPGSQAECYSGPDGTKNIGHCKAGQKTCKDDGSGYGDCTGEVLPAPETCATPFDDDCNGQTNESGPGCVCTPGMMAPCYGGPMGTQDVGICKGGMQMCKDDGTGFGDCVGQVLPATETCDAAGIDENCNGQVNEGGANCVCVPGSTKPCYDGPPNTNGFGVCKSGTVTCTPDGLGYTTECAGEIVPTPEVCDGQLIDENCDGQVNEGGPGCACVPGSIKACYDGPAGTENVGACLGGAATCNDQGTNYGACVGEVLPAPETCLTTFDDDCNGQVNESGAGCVCVPGSTAPCYDGPAGTENVGVCHAGLKTCSAQGTGYGSCQNEVVPSTETCATPEDDDCNGTPLVCGSASQDCNPNTGLCEDACSPTVLGTSYVGCTYYPTVTANLTLSNVFHFSVVVSNTSAKPATVTVTRGAAFTTTVTVAANSVQIINLPWVTALKGPDSNASIVPFPASVQVANGAYKLVSNRPVTVYQYNPLEYTVGGTFSYSNDASLLLPVNVWTGDYRVISRHHFATASGFYAVTAQANNTTVTLTAGPNAVQVKGGIAGISANGTGKVVLNNASDPNDLTGALVTADKPVQVIGGHQCVYIPDTVGYCDHLEESIFPIETLARDYIVTAPLIPTGGNVPKAEMVRIVAAEDNTTLTYDPPQAGAPASIAKAGGWVEISQTSQSFAIHSTTKIDVMQYMLGQDAGGNSGDPAMAQAVGLQQYRTNYLFHAPTNYEKNYVNITAPTGATVTLDGAAVSGFVAIGGTGYGMARLLLPNTNGGNHTVVGSQPVGISVYGYGQYTSYWYPGGLDLKLIQ
jgi:hypothetical protein